MTAAISFIAGIAVGWLLGEMIHRYRDADRADGGGE